MIPICLVTGFLGSGKTTFLRYLIDRHREEKIVYLVNEFSPLDIDGALLRDAEEDVVTVPGGSIFCKCLVTEFAGNLQRIPERFGSVEESIRGVVVEASGIANPMVIEQMLAETGLDGTYDLTMVVTIVDPGSLPKLIHTLPNIEAQILAADTVLLNKIDLFSVDEADCAAEIVREIAPAVSVVRTTRCEVDLNLFEPGRLLRLEGEYAECVDPNFARMTIDFTGPVEIGELTSLLAGAADDIYRVKGVFPTADGRRCVDMSPAELRIGEEAGGTAVIGLIVIVNAGAEDRMERLFERLGCASSL